MSFFVTDQVRLQITYYFDLLYEMVRRDLKVQYEGTLLGFAWTLLMPFLQLGIFYFLFKVILGVTSTRFTSFAFIGIVAYLWFQSALSQATASITSNRELALRPGFPIPLLPFIAVSSSMLHFVFTFPLISLIVLLEEHRLPSAALLMPIVMAVQFTLCLGLGYLTATLSIIFRDSKQILDVLLRLFYFLSPVFYDANMVPQRYRWLYDLNPMVTLLQSYRDILMHGKIPQLIPLFVLALISLAIVWIGLRVFQKQSYRFLDEI
jgi:lipopolysaccharide transport system permease protein